MNVTSCDIVDVAIMTYTKIYTTWNYLLQFLQMGNGCVGFFFTLDVELLSSETSAATIVKVGRTIFHFITFLTI